MSFIAFLIQTTQKSALKSGHVSAVGLDVYERESSYFFADSSAKVIADDSFARLLSFYNVFMT
jgi:D-lactate dehydrogenase